MPFPRDALKGVFGLAVLLPFDGFLLGTRCFGFRLPLPPDRAFADFGRGIDAIFQVFFAVSRCSRASANETSGKAPSAKVFCFPLIR